MRMWLYALARWGGASVRCWSVAGIAGIKNPAEVLVLHAAHEWMFFAVRWWVWGLPVGAECAAQCSGAGNAHRVE